MRSLKYRDRLRSDMANASAIVESDMAESA